MKNSMNKFDALYDTITELLSSAPDEDDCSDEENEVYAECANLRSALMNAGYCGQMAD